jgi:hypothetical protein
MRGQGFRWKSIGQSVRNDVRGGNAELIWKGGECAARSSAATWRLELLNSQIDADARRPPP